VEIFNLFVFISVFYKLLFRHFFLNFPLLSFHHSRHSRMAFFRSAGELAG